MTILVTLFTKKPICFQFLISSVPVMRTPVVYRIIPKNIIPLLLTFVYKLGTYKLLIKKAIDTDIIATPVKVGEKPSFIKWLVSNGVL